MVSKLDRIKKWLEGGKAPPWHMQLQPTAKCNLACKFCWSSRYKREEKELSDEKWIEITREACEMGVKALTIVGGGEPLIRLNLVREMVRIIKGYDVWGTIVTNGTLFTQDFARELVEIGWDSVAISIDGATAETDNYLRGNNAFELTMKSIHMINKWKEELSSEKPNIIFHSVITRQNVHELLDMIKLAKKARAGTFVLRMVNDDFSNPKFFITPEQFELLKRQVEEVVEFAKKEEIDLDWQMNLEDVRRILFNEKPPESSVKEERVKKKAIPCSRPFCEMVIIPDGTAGPCCAFCEGKYLNKIPLGDLPPKVLLEKKLFYKQLVESVMEYVDDITNKSLKEVWEGEAFTKFRELVKKGEVPFFCKKTCPLDYVYLEESGKIVVH